MWTGAIILASYMCVVSHIYMFVVIKMDNKSVEATPACAPGHSRWHLVKDFHIIRFLKWFSKC